MTTLEPNYALKHFILTGSLSEKKFINYVLKKVIDTKSGLSLVNKIMSINNEKINLIYSKNIGYGSQGYNNKSMDITLNNRSIWIIENSGKEKVVTNKKLFDEVSLFHELNHQLQFLTYGLKIFDNLLKSPSNNPDYHNRLEEEAITEGPFSERSFCKDNSYPERFNHSGSFYPPAFEMKTKSFLERKMAFLNYLILGAEKDLMIIAETFNKEAVEDFLNELFLGKDIELIGRIEKDFLPTLGDLISIQKLEVNQKKLNQFLLSIASAVIENLEDINELKKLGFDFSSVNKNGENILFNIKPFSLQYPDIINSLVKEQKIDINHTNKKGFSFFNKPGIEISIDNQLKLKKMGACFNNVIISKVLIGIFFLIGASFLIKKIITFLKYKEF